MTYHTADIRSWCTSLSAGDTIFLSGTVYTARDAAHKRLTALLEQQQPLPFDLTDSVIYYAGPTPAKPGTVIGSCGPTTSSRMDPFAPMLLHHGLCAMIGKGPRNQAVMDAIRETNGIYFCAVGGAGAIAARHICRAEVIAFDDLGCESIKRLEFHNFPLIVGIDSRGNSLFPSR